MPLWLLFGYFHLILWTITLIWIIAAKWSDVAWGTFIYFNIFSRPLASVVTVSIRVSVVSTVSSVSSSVSFVSSITVVTSIPCLGRSFGISFGYRFSMVI